MKNTILCVLFAIALISCEKMEMARPVEQEPVQYLEKHGAMPRYMRSIDTCNHYPKDHDYVTYVENVYNDGVLCMIREYHVVEHWIYACDAPMILMGYSHYIKEIHIASCGGNG
jgi:hypothetical protein